MHSWYWANIEKRNQINTKNYWKKKRRLCVKLFEVTNTTCMRKSANCKAQIRTMCGGNDTDLCIAICRFSHAGCVCHLEQLHAQSPFLFPIVFSINTILSQHDIENAIAKAQSAIETNIDKWTCQGSGWVVTRVETMYVNIAKYQPLTGSSYMELSDTLKSKKAIINVKNDDQKCLMWSLLSARHPVKKNAQRVTKYNDHEKKLNFAGIEFPTPLNQIPNVEHQNN